MVLGRQEGAFQSAVSWRRSVHKGLMAVKPWIFRLRIVSCGMSIVVWESYQNAMNTWSSIE